MIRIFFTLLIFLVSMQANINSKIVKNQKILKIKKAKALKIKDKLEDIAASIKKLQSEIKDIDENIAKSDEFLSKQKDEYSAKNKELDNLRKQISSLNKLKSSTERELIDLISKELSLQIILKQDNFDNVESVITNESIETLSKIVKDKFNNIKNRYEDTNSKIESVSVKVKDLKKYIKTMQDKKEMLKKMKAKRVRSIRSLKYKKIAYDKKLNRIFSEQNAIKRTLKKLNILKIKSTKKSVTPKLSNINKQKVKKIGNSYIKGKIAKYRGPKTIAPLRSFYVKRKFGNYFDPIYKIKIFNESVTLSSKIPNAKVRNVLNGKVIFAKSTPILDNVVIIENARGIHTIYAHLSKIAPTVKKGMKIRKGYIIGRVKKDLIFEVTQKNSHINPLRLIRY